MTSYIRTMREALEEMHQNLNEDNLEKMRKAAGGAKQTLKMKDGSIGMDSFTASAIMQIYDKINDKNKKTFENMMNNGKKADIMKLAKFAMSKVNAEYVPEEFEEEFELDEKVQFEAPTKDGNTFQIIDRDTKGMAGKQDKFKMQIVDKRGKVIKDLGSHASLNGAKGMAKNRGIIEEVELDEGKMSAAQIAKLKKAYEPMRGKKISMASGQKLSSIMDKVDDDKEALSQLVKADIPFVSQLAVTRLITKHGMKGAEIRKMQEEVELDEGAAADARRAMRGDPDMRQRAFSKDDSATDDERKAASKNIMMQMRKAVSLRSFDVEFADGKKVKIPQKVAQSVLQKYNSFRKPADKEKYQAKVGKSYKDMLAALKEGFASDAQRRAAFARGYKAKGKKDKKESTLERMNKKIQEKKNGQ